MDAPFQAQSRFDRDRPLGHAAQRNPTATLYNRVKGEEMKKSYPLMAAVVVLSMVMVVGASIQAQAFEIEIDVAPNVLNIQSESTVVTVHTDIAYSTVAGATVFLNGVAIDWWKADARGNFVAKFNSDEIKTLPGLEIGAFNTLTLCGFTTGGEAFIGMQDILVVDNVPAGKN
jgi:hypothetical protein